MARTPRTPTEAEVTRLAGIRATAETAADQAHAARRAELIAQSPDPDRDLTGAIAWHEVALGETDPATIDLVHRAREHGRLEWREIAPAFGVAPGDDGAVEMLAQRYRRRRR